MRDKLLLVTCLLTFASQAANATWKESSFTDALTKEKHPFMSSIGHGAIHQFGHSVTSQLIIRCVHPRDGSSPFLIVDLLFSEKVAVGDVKARLLFDAGRVRELEIGAYDNGNQFSVLFPGLDELKTSKKLRTQVSLPWAGDPVIEFDTTGALDALNRMPCKEWHSNAD
jgi:hypothetical protein